MTPVEIIKRLAKQEGNRSNVEGTWRDIARYIMPLSTQEFYGQNGGENSKKWTTREVWDSTAPIGAERLASIFYSNMFSPSFRWFSLGFRNPALNGDREAKAWLEAVSDIMFAAISASNFGPEIAACLHMLVGFGNGGISGEPVNPESWEGLEFSTLPLEDIYYEPDHRGRPRVFWRKYRWTPGQIVSKFVDEKGAPLNVPEHVVKKAEQGATEPMEVVFCVYPRVGAAPMSKTEKIRAPNLRPFEYHYVLRKDAVFLGKEGGYYEMPVFQGPWLRAAGSNWGFGPGALALPTVKLANAWLEAMTDSAEKVVDPATIVTERGLLSDLDLKKGGLTTVRSLDDIKPYESAARFDVSESLLADMRNQIRKYFREDDTTLKDSPAMTATEAQLRVELLNRLFGPTVGNITNNIADPMLQWVFSVMYRADRFPPPPASVMESDSTLQIEYLGPFMRAQRLDEVAAIERLAAGVAALKKMNFEEAGDVFDPVGTVRELAERLATPAACLRSPQDVRKLAQQRAEMQKAAAVAEIKKTDAEASRAGAQAASMGGGNGAAA